MSSRRWRATGLLPVCFNLPNRSATPLENGFFYHYTYQQEMADKLDPIDKQVLAYWEKTPFFKPEYGKKEKILYLRRIKSRREVYERLLKIRPLNSNEILEYARSLFLHGDFKELKDYLCMLMSIAPYSDEAKLWKLQIEIAERKIKKRGMQEE